MAMASHMLSSSSVTAFTLSWGIDESDVVAGVFVIDVAVNPRVGIVKTGLSGRNMSSGSFASDVIG